MKDILIECWDDEENLGLIRVDEASLADSNIDLEREWSRWYDNTVACDESLDVESFCEWLEIEHEIKAERAHVIQINC